MASANQCRELTINLLIFITAVLLSNSIESRGIRRESNYPWQNVTIRNRRASRNCHRRVVKNDIDLDELRKRARSLKVRLTGEKKEFIQGFNDFKFSKYGCKKNDSECRCRDQGDSSTWPIYAIEAIRGGYVAPEHGIPWMVFIKTNRGSICAGFMISYQFVLTAGHCLQNSNYVNVTYGVHDLDNVKNEKFVTITYKPIDYRIHPDMNNKNTGFFSHADIAIIFISNWYHQLGFRIGPYTSPACLSHTPPKRNSPCLIAGWGQILPPFYKGASRNLRFVRYVTGYTQSEFTFAFPITMSARTAVGGCLGDSGAPLMCTDYDDVTRVYGIFLKGHDAVHCSGLGSPHHFLSIAYYSQWINTTMKEFKKYFLGPFGRI